MVPQSRRDFLTHTGGGFASVALSALLADELQAAPPQQQPIDPLQPLAERLPHFLPKAKRVIFLFQYGGPSTFDLLDYKPQLLKLNGQPVPESFKQNPDKVGGVFHHCKDELMAGELGSAWPVGAMGFGTTAAYREADRRAVSGAVDVQRKFQSRAGDLSDEHRGDSRR